MLKNILSGSLFGGIFFISGIANILPLYAGFSYEGCTEATWLSRGILFVWMICSYFFTAKIFSQNNTKGLIILIIVILFYACSFLFWYLSFGYTSLLQRCLSKGVGLMLPALLLGFYYGWHNKKFLNIALYILEMCSPIFFVFAFFYDMGIIGIVSNLAYKGVYTNVGLLNYMSISYMLMPFLLVHVVHFVLRESIIKSVFCKNCIQCFRFLAIIMYSFALVLAATRGTICCVIVALVFFAIINIYHKYSLRRTIFIVGIVLGILFTGMLFPGTGLNQRIEVVESGLQEGKLVTSRSSDINTGEIERLVKLDYHNNEWDSIPKISNRGTLYTLAIKEFQKSPIVGMYPGGYWEKYKLYPHNIFLEVICELGIFSILIFSFIYIAGKTIVCDAVADEQKIGIFVLFIAYILRACVSGSFWTDYFICAFMGYGLARKVKKQTP